MTTLRGMASVMLAQFLALAGGCGDEPIDPLLCLNERGSELIPFDQLGYVAHGRGSLASDRALQQQPRRFRDQLPQRLSRV